MRVKRIKFQTVSTAVLVSGMSLTNSFSALSSTPETSVPLYLNDTAHALFLKGQRSGSHNKLAKREFNPVRSDFCWRKNGWLCIIQREDHRWLLAAIYLDW